MITRTVLRYHGGKWLLAPWIIQHFPQHRVYVEPYGGAASVLMRKPRSYAEVYNDLAEHIVNVFRVLRSPVLAKELERMIRLTPFSRVEFDYCTQERLDATEDPVERARLTLFRSFAGFGSSSSIATNITGFRNKSTRSGTSPAHDWMNYPKRIAQFTQRLQGVVIECRDAKEVMAQHDADTTLHYVDPPYHKDTRNKSKRNVYMVEMNHQEHEALLAFLKGLNGMVVLSAYEHEVYDNMLSGWLKVSKKTYADGASPRSEVLWLNPKAADRQKTKLLFS